MQSVKAQKLEGLVAKRRDSRYEPGEGSGAWRKMRVNREQRRDSGRWKLQSARSRTCRKRLALIDFDQQSPIAQAGEEAADLFAADLG